MVRKNVSRLLVAILVLFPVLAFAVDPAVAADPASPIPAYLTMLADVVTSIPVVGPVVLRVFEYAAIVGSIFTALATFALAVSKSVVGIARLAKLVELAAKLQALHDKVWPWIAYLSMYNVQRKKRVEAAEPK